MHRILIGIDDTDNETSPGTGRLARDLGEYCAGRGMRVLGVTRHQFLVDPAIPYTSHNSGACVELEGESDCGGMGFVFDYVQQHSAAGSDPGVCVAEADEVAASVVRFGRAAAERVLDMEQARETARLAGLELRGLGGTNQGIIGALGSVGQRAGGNEGRFIDLPGLRELCGCVEGGKYGEIGIEIEHRVADRPPECGDRYETFDWVRPRLIGGRPVLPVEWSSQYNAWIPVDRKKSKGD